MSRFAILVDGDYMKKQLESKLKRFPTVQDFRDERRRLFNAYADTLSPGDVAQLYRIFYYTADPYDGKQSNPLRGAINFAMSKTYRQNTTLIEQLERENDVAVRRGVVVFQGWQLTNHFTNRLIGQQGPTPPSLSASDLRANFKQKGVDMCIGLDIATLALKRLVRDIVVVTGDLDMVPAFKLARTEGLRVYVDMMGAGGRRKLRVHSDRVL